MFRKILQENSFSGILMAILVAGMPFFFTRKLFFAAGNIRYFIIIGVVYLLSLVYVLNIWRVKKYGLILRKRCLFFLLLFVFFIYIITSFTGVHVAQSFWSDILRSSGVIFLGHIGILIFLLAELLNKQDWVLLRRSFILSTTFFSLFYFFTKAGLGLLYGGLFDIKGAMLGNETFAGAYILFGIAFTLIELSHNMRWSKRFGFWFGALMVQLISPLFLNFNILSGTISLRDVFLQPALLLGDARASSAVAIAMLLYVIGLAVLRRVIRQKSYKNIASNIYTGLGIVASVTLVIMLLVPGSFVQDAYTKQATAARPIVWNIAWQGIADRPLLGWGAENYEFINYTYFDNRLYLKENLSEIWFDRAHNVFIDTLATVGVIGLIGLFVLLGYLIFVFRRAGHEGDISRREAYLLGLLLVAHIVQLQTAFEVIPTYFAGALVIGYALWLEKKHLARCDVEGKELSPANKKIVAGGMIILVILGSLFFFGKELSRQRALHKMFVTGNKDARFVLINKALSRPGSFEVLRRGSNSMIKGTISQADVVLANQNNISKVLEEIDLYQSFYESYLERVSDDYRARMSFAYLLFFSTSLGNNQIDLAQEIIAPGYELSPNNPLTYIMDSLSYVYQGDFEKADEIIAAASVLNPGVAMTKQVQQYIQLQKQSFPRINFLNLENL